MSELGNEVVVEDKGKKKRVSTEDKLQLLLDKQFERIESMIDDKFKKMDGLIDGKLDHSQYRMYNSVKAELRRWYTGYYDTSEND